MPELLRSLLAILLIVAGATAWGLGLQGRRGSALDRLVSATGTGLILSSYGIFLLGFLKLSVFSLSGWFLLPLLWPGRFRECLRLLKHGALELVRTLYDHPVGRAFLLAYPLLLLCCLTPNTHYDTHAYHYAIPELYLRQGSMRWTWTSYFEGLVQATHMLFLAALGIGGEFAANMLGAVYLLLLVASLLTMNCSWPKRWPVLLLLLMGSPVLVFQGLGGLVDLPVSFYLFMALREILVSPGKPLRCAFWCGAAISTKATAILSTLCLLLAAPRLIGCRRMPMLSIFSLALLMGTPWWLRNFWATGDPLSPLLSNWTLPAWDWNPFSLISLPVYAQDSSYLKNLSLEARSWKSFQFIRDSVHPVVWMALLVPGRLRVLVWTTFVPVLWLSQTDLRYALPFLTWWALHFACAVEPRRRIFWLVWVGALPGIACLAGILWLRLPLLANPPLQREFLMERGPFSGYLFLSQRAQVGDRAVIIGRRGYRCPIDYQCADTLPAREWKMLSTHEGFSAEKFDYCVVDLREPRVMLAVSSLVMKENPGRVWHWSELARGPLRLSKPGDLHRRLLDAGLLNPESGAVLNVPDDNAQSLQFFLRALWTADVLFADESVVVLTAPRSAGKDEPVGGSKRCRP